MWPVFVTAVNPPPKELNRAFLLIQDFEYGDYPDSSEWTLLTSRDLPPMAEKATPLPLPDISSNDFASISLAEINSFLRANEAALKEINVSSADWLIIDQKGLETSTCLVCEQIYSYGEEEAEKFEEEEGPTKEFRACRIPYEEAWSMMTNLEIANMDFVEWVDENAGVQEDGTWRWKSFEPETDDSEEPSKHELEREKAMEEFRLGGYIN
ncbi:hypothetical protein DFH06DRAFT_1092991 [Mycena polygramma]|nr:hypothetical protein DFH06DRAFT_1092991 [Mycena polygramma]